MDISASLKKLRTFHNLSQATVAIKVNMPLRTYQSYELGKRELSLSNAFKLADFYKISVDRLCTFDKELPNIEP